MTVLKKSSIVLSVTTGSISIVSFATVVGAPVGIASASFSLAFSISIEIVEKMLKTMQNKKKRQNKIVMLTRSKLNIIESKISEALINSEISHEDLITTINKEKNYREIKESIKMMKTQRNDTEKNYLIEERKRKSIDEVIY